MWRWRAVAVLLCAVVLAGCSGGSGDDGAAGDAPAWSHNPEDDGLGPGSWGSIDESFEQCSAGKQQSPVDITNAVRADLPVLGFDYPETSLVVENTGHTIEITPESDDLRLAVGAKEYRLVQFHLHAPSEHTVDGSHYAAEIHLVHESEDGELAVVALPAHPNPPALPLLGEAVEQAPDEAGEEVELEGEWNLLELFFADDSTTVVGVPYYTYPGSLTTPGCTEGVSWIVIQSIYPMSQEAVDRLHELIAGFPGHDGYRNNNRPLQPLSGRVIRNDPPF